MRLGIPSSFLALIVAGTAALGAGPPANEQRTVDPSLTAAFLYTFVKFVDWPPDALPANGPIQLCVDDPLVADALEPLVVGRMIGEHHLVVLRVTKDVSLRSCHVLYVGGLGIRRAVALVAALEDASVWSISDYDGFTVVGGVARLFRESGRLRFAINLESARRARLHISSRLLSLATIVRDDNRELPRAERR